MLGRLRRSGESGSWPIDWAPTQGPDVRSWTDAAGTVRVTLAGAPAARSISPDDIPGAVASALAGTDPRPDRLRQLLNLWALVVEERKTGTVHFATDPLGLYPLFWDGPRPDAAFGSDVWRMRAAGYAPSKSVDPRAVASWVLFAADFTGGSVLAGVRRMPAGTVLSVRAGRVSTHDYCGFEHEGLAIHPVQAADLAHEIVRANLVASVGAVGRHLALGLSGGNDSRLLASIGSRLPGVDVLAYTVEWDPAEARAAEGVERALGLRRLRLEVPRSLYDFYECRDQFLPSGFPYVPFVVNEAVRRFTGARPQVHGFIGGIILAGRGGASGPIAERERPVRERALEARRANAMEGGYLFRDSIRRGLEASALPAIEEMLRSTPPGADPALRINLRLRQRFYIAPSFLSYLDAAPTVLPFYGHEILDFRFRHDLVSISERIYPEIFARHHPELIGLPVDRELREQALTARWARSSYLRKRAAALVPGLLGRRHPAFERHRALPRLLVRAAGRPAATNWVSMLDRLERLERQLRSQDLAIDWKRIASLAS